MTHDELLDKIYWSWRHQDTEYFGLSGYRNALRAVVELCSSDGYMTWDKSMVSKIDGVYDKAEAKKWEEIHGHDIRLKCYAENECQLLLDPQTIIQAIEKEMN